MIEQKIVKALLGESVYKEFPSEQAATQWLADQGYQETFKGGGGTIYQKGEHKLYLSSPAMYDEPIWRVGE